MFRRALCGMAAAVLCFVTVAAAHEGMLHEAHDNFPQYTDVESQTIADYEAVSNKQSWLTCHVLGTLESEGGEITLLNRPFDNQFDPQQTGHGIIGHSGSTVILRNAKISSENPAEVPGHLLFTGSCSVSLESCLIDGVGRTTLDQLDNAHLGPNRVVLHVPQNQIGRYALHLHHLTVPFSVVDTALINGRKVAVAIHNSDSGLLERVLVDNFKGAGIVFEAGTEEANVVDHCRVTNIRGDGLGVQGHDGGIDAKLVGDDTPGNPRRTIGGTFSEGAAYWFRSIANDFTNNYAADADFGAVIWGRLVLEDPDSNVDGITQRGHRFASNVFERVKTGLSIQGTLGTFLIENQVVRDFGVAYDTSYNQHVVLQDCLLENGQVCWRNGFTDKVTLNNVTVRNVAKGFEILANLSVTGGDFTGIPGPAFDIYYRHVPRQQRSIVIRDALMNGLSYRFNDPDKNADYGIPQDVLAYNHRGEDFQVFMREQAASYVPKKTDPNPYRVTPEAGLTNGELWAKYAWQFGGKPLPPGVVAKPGIAGWCAPIGDLTQPKILERTVTTTASSITIRCTTDKPARIRTEYAIGDIKLGVWPAMMLPDADYKTVHEVTISGLKGKTKYSFRQPVVDEAGNLGGDTRTAGINYQVQTATTK